MSTRDLSTQQSKTSNSAWNGRFRTALRRRRERRAPADLARKLSFADWAEIGRFVADREPFSFKEWRFLRPIYEAVEDPKHLDLVIQKGAQAGASIFSLLFTLWLALKGRVQIAYFLPTQAHALKFSTDRFIRMVRDNRGIHQLMGDEGSPHNRKIVDEGSASIRRILSSVIHFTFMGGKVTTEALPLDALVFDEVQEMALAEMEKAEERLSASPLRSILRVSTANFAGSDINYFFDQSDQREFHTKCGCADGVVLAEAWDPRLGPLCIDRGSGANKAVPTEPFYVCPRCKTIITDPQDGRFVARYPGRKRIGFHFPQLLSPRQTPGDILFKWENRIDTKNFFNRILGLPYTDPSTQPVSLEHLSNAQNPALRWGPPRPGEYEGGVYMGVDQMGHDSRAVIVAKAPSGKMRLLHLEMIQNDDPFRRVHELMTEYRVRIAAIEALPNYNEAHKFAKEFPGRVFVVSYHDLESELLVWGDRPRDKATMRKTDEEAKLRWGVSVDQYKMASWALGKWATCTEPGRGQVETPDARTLLQRVKLKEGVRQVQLCKEIFWEHMTHIALVTELVEGKEDERKLRRAVRKVGMDPHFAYAWLLMCVAWVRAYGTDQMLLPPLEVEERRLAPAGLAVSPAGAQRAAARRDGRAYTSQIKAAMPHLFGDDVPMMIAAGATTESRAKADLVCGSCTNFDRERNYCVLRDLYTAAQEPLCEFYDPTRSDDQEWE